MGYNVVGYIEILDDNSNRDVILDNPAKVIRDRIAWVEYGNLICNDIEDYKNFIFE